MNMNESENQSKLSIIFHQFEVLINYVKSKQYFFYMSKELQGFFKQYEEYEKLIKSGGEYDYTKSLDLYNKFKKYFPDSGKSKLILNSIENVFKSFQSQYAFQSQSTDLKEKSFDEPILDLIKTDFHEKIKIMKKEISEHQIEIARLKLQSRALFQQYNLRIRDISNYIDQLSDFCKSISPENIKKADDHQIRMICDLIYIVDKMQ